MSNGDDPDEVRHLQEEGREGKPLDQASAEGTLAVHGKTAGILLEAAHAALDFMEKVETESPSAIFIERMASCSSALAALWKMSRVTKTVRGAR